MRCDVSSCFRTVSNALSSLLLRSFPVVCGARGGLDGLRRLLQDVRDGPAHHLLERLRGPRGALRLAPRRADAAHPPRAPADGLPPAAARRVRTQREPRRAEARRGVSRAFGPHLPERRSSASGGIPLLVHLYLRGIAACRKASALFHGPRTKRHCVGCCLGRCVGRCRDELLRCRYPTRRARALAAWAAAVQVLGLACTVHQLALRGQAAWANLTGAKLTGSTI